MGQGTWRGKYLCMYGVGTYLLKVRIPFSAAGQPGWGVAGRCVGKCRTISCFVNTSRSREIGIQRWFELGIRGVHGFDGLFGHYLFTLSNRGEVIHQPPRPLTVIPPPFPEAPGGTPRNPAKADSSTCLLRLPVTHTPTTSTAASWKHQAAFTNRYRLKAARSNHP